MGLIYIKQILSSLVFIGPMFLFVSIIFLRQMSDRGRFRYYLLTGVVMTAIGAVAFYYNMEDLGLRDPAPRKISRVY